MPVLFMDLPGKKNRRYSLAKGQKLRIGRLEDNDIVISDAEVSRYHAEIENGEDGCYLTDCHSKNGTFVNKRPVGLHRLKPGDSITLGRTRFVFVYDEGEVASDPDSHGASAKTCGGESAGEITALGDGSIAKKGDALPSGVLSFLKGGKGGIPIGDKPVTIGKDPASDIVVSGVFVGETAVEIIMEADGAVLISKGGIVRPRVNCRKVKDRVALNEFDIIEIASVKLQFHLTKNLLVPPRGGD